MLNWARMSSPLKEENPTMKRLSLLVFVILQRYLRGGLALGGLRG